VLILPGIRLGTKKPPTKEFSAFSTPKPKKPSEIEKGTAEDMKSRNMIRVPADGQVTFGVARGATINMGDFESARIDYFIIRNVTDDEEIIREQKKEMTNLLDEFLIEEIDKISSNE
jgi:hypothetical protein